MVLVKTLVYHTLGTLMPYPSEDPPRLLKVSLPDRRLFMPLVLSGLNSLPVGREASIASPIKSAYIHYGHASFSGAEGLFANRRSSMSAL
jgi:hypothetical protein